ncbi:hypothetical protein V1264_012891 [Littorina saxatilis]|uniref:Uncharacterized protein n=1 Tax=Littorina saxatilis TaxID=31220 RepID=A0AAN9BYI2_9CAEN
MAGKLKIGSHLFAKDDHEHYRNLPVLPRPTPSSYKDDSPRAADEMATDSTRCQHDSDCTHDAQCAGIGSEKHCICFETGTHCDAKPKPTPKLTPEPKPKDSPRAADEMATDSTRCQHDSDCTHDAQCAGIGSEKHCICFETGTHCDAKPKLTPKPTPKLTPEPKTKDHPEPETPLRDSSQSSLEATYCLDDDDCPPQAVCFDTGSDHKQCFCYTTRVFCKAQRKPQAVSPCGEQCPPNTVCDPSSGCKPICPDGNCKGLTPSEHDEQSNSSLDPTHCYNDEDCDEDATCVDANLGTKQCFCYETGDFCKSRQKQPDGSELQTTPPLSEASTSSLKSSFQRPQGMLEPVHGLISGGGFFVRFTT